MVCVVWGTTYLAIRISLETIPPLLMAGLRWIIAGTLLIGFLKARGAQLPGPRSWPALGALGILLIGFGNGCIVWAEQTVPSGLTAVLAATMPFWFVGVDAAMPDGAPLTRKVIAGLIIGFVGNVLLVWPEIDAGAGRGFLAGVVAIQLACLGWAVGSAYARRRGSQENVLVAAAFEMLFGGIALLIVALLLRERMMVPVTTRSAAAFVYLIAFGSIVGFSAFVYALKHLPVATVSLYAYVNPVIAVALGTLILKEPFSARMAVAGVVVFAGVAIVRQGNP